MSMHRAFPSTPVIGTQHSAAKVACSKCDATAEITTQTGARRLPPDAIARKFRTRGWHIGHTPNKDRCPDCNGSARKKTHQEEPMGLQKDTPVIELRAPKPGASETAPREITREDRRIVFAKLEEVYVNEATGYQKGWNDLAVAKDLNVPRAWVEVIRDENFGPQKAEQSAEVIELRDRIAVFEHEQTQLVLQCAGLAKDAERIAAEARGVIEADRAIAEKMKTLRDDLRKLVGVH